MRGGKAARGLPGALGHAAAGRLLAAALRQDLRVLTSDKPFTLNGTKFPSGTLIFKVKENPADLAERLAELAVRPAPTSSAPTPAGSTMASTSAAATSTWCASPPSRWPGTRPVSSQSAGATRFVLERQFGYPVTTIRAAQMSSADLSRFNVLILPPGGNYAQAFGPAGIRS